MNNTVLRDILQEYKLIIPLYEKGYELSKHQRAKYWKCKDLNKAPQRVKKNFYNCKVFGNDIFLTSITGERFLKNTIKAGTPNIWKANMQDLYNGTLHPLTRGKVTKYFHHYFQSYIEKQLVNPIVFSEEVFLKISLIVYDDALTFNLDLFNFGSIYIKWFEDALVLSKKIPNDNLKYIRDTGQTTFINIKNSDDRKVEFKLELYNEKHL